MDITIGQYGDWLIDKLNKVVVAYLGELRQSYLLPLSK